MERSDVAGYQGSGEYAYEGRSEGTHVFLRHLSADRGTEALAAWDYGVVPQTLRKKLWTEARSLPAIYRLANMAPHSKGECHGQRLRCDAVGDFSWRSRTGSSEATHCDGYVIVPSRRPCPHRWIDNRGPIDLERARSKPYEEWL